MFEHLDDSEPFTPDDERLLTLVYRGRRQRRWRRLGGSALSVVALAGVLGAGLLYVARRDAAIDRDEIVTTPSVDGATNVLLVGSDEDNGLSGGRADTMAVVRVDADEAVRVLSIPRDLWNPDAGRRLNESLAGGPDQLIADVTSLTRIPIDHYVQMSFEGFSDLVDAAGGIELRIDTALRDRSSGLEVMSDPCARLDGEQALALLRSRHLELAAGATGGRWVVDGSGDLGRMARSRVVIDAALASLASTSIAELDRLSRVVADHAIVDDEMTLRRMVDLGRALRDAADQRVEGETVPVYVSFIDRSAVLEPADGAAETYERFGAPSAGTSETHPGGRPPAAVSPEIPNARC